METLGLYIHIPFCLRKCRYCDFTSFAGKETLHGRYVEAVLKEAALYKKRFEGYAVDSVYIGGGTPACLREGLIKRLFSGLREAFFLQGGAEVTIEANPGVLTEAKLAEYRESGVNRISLGLQSHDDALLQILGRVHNYAQFEEAYRMAREAGFFNINVDVMFGLPGQTEENFKETLQLLIEKQPEHISAYALKIEENTPFYAEYKDAPPVGEASERNMYHAAVRLLKNAGYRHYETSNFARKGHECRHNLKYWQQEEYLGLGVSAHSYFWDGGAFFRQENGKSLKDYLAAAENGRAPVREKTGLSPYDHITEYLMLRLRLAEGIGYADFYNRFGFDFKERFHNAIARLQKAHLIREDGRGIRPLLRGFDMQNTLILEFIKNV